MNPQIDTLSLVALTGWLVLMIAGYSSYRLNWSKTVTMALIWFGIFFAVAGVIALVQGSADAGEAIGPSL